MISNLAYVHPDAKIGNNVIIEPFAYIEGDVVIGDDCWIGPHACIYNGARLGKGNKVHPGACIACLPQDLKFAGEQTTAVIGDYNDIRECVTIARGTASRGTTVVGDHNLLMAYVHVAHDDVVGSHCVIANRVSLAGEVEVGDWVVIGGHAALHQWIHIGDHAMIQGGALVTQDVPPFIIATNGRRTMQVSTRWVCRAEASHRSRLTLSTTPAASCSRASLTTWQVATRLRPRLPRHLSATN